MMLHLLLVSYGINYILQACFPIHLYCYNDFQNFKR